MNGEQWRAEVKRAQSANTAQQRRQRWKPRSRSLQAVQGAGMVRILPPASERPAEAGRHTQGVSHDRPG